MVHSADRRYVRVPRGGMRQLRKEERLPIVPDFVCMCFEVGSRGDVGIVLGDRNLQVGPGMVLRFSPGQRLQAFAPQCVERIDRVDQGIPARGRRHVDRMNAGGIGADDQQKDSGFASCESERLRNGRQRDAREGVSLQRLVM